jgi:hypothetical protein
MPKIDDESYSQGRQAFRDGISLRTVVQRMLDAEHVRDITDDEGARIVSFGIGFADELIDVLRAIPPKVAQLMPDRGEYV